MNARRPILRWAVNTTAWSPSRTEWVTAMRLVDCDEERRRINRFVFKRDAKHALVGRLLIRKCCRHFLSSDDHQQLFNSASESSPQQSLRLTRSEKGKPILLKKSEVDGTESPYQAFQFNVSHSGDYCVLAADSTSPKLGVDIMKVECSGGLGRLADFFRTMQRQFSEAEWRYIREATADEAKLARFIRLWSLKESLVKAEGSGIVLPLSRLSFACPTELVAPEVAVVSNSSVTVNPGGRPLPEPWAFEEVMLDRLHYVSVAKIRRADASEDQNNNHQQHFEVLAIEDLLGEEEQAQTFSSGHLCTYDDEKHWTDFCRKT